MWLTINKEKKKTKDTVQFKLKLAAHCTISMEATENNGVRALAIHNNYMVMTAK